MRRAGAGLSLALGPNTACLLGGVGWADFHAEPGASRTVHCSCAVTAQAALALAAFGIVSSMQTCTSAGPKECCAESVGQEGWQAKLQYCVDGGSGGSCRKGSA